MSNKRVKANVKGWRDYTIKQLNKQKNNQTYLKNKKKENK